MKNVIQILVIAVLIVLPFILLSQPMPWDPSIGGGAGAAPVGGGAPVGEGIILLVSMGMWYGVRKWSGIKNSD